MENLAWIGWAASSWGVSWGAVEVEEHPERYGGGGEQGPPARHLARERELEQEEHLEMLRQHGQHLYGAKPVAASAEVAAESAVEETAPVSPEAQDISPEDLALRREAKQVAAQIKAQQQAVHEAASAIADAAVAAKVDLKKRAALEQARNEALLLAAFEEFF